jgi:RNA polymerase sigma-70 factor (ECF subfamily)
MAESEPISTPATAAAADSFAPTRWTVVLTAREADSPKTQAAMEDLCRVYWPPLYAFIRRKGYNREDAEDLTQGFFTRLLQTGDLAKADQSRGKFRSFLLASLDHFVTNEWDKKQRQKRGGGQAPISLDFVEAEAKHQLAVSDTMTPEKHFDRIWGLKILDDALAKVQAEYVAKGKERQFQALKALLVSTKPPDAYADLAGQAGLEQGSVKVIVHRLRARYREVIRKEVSQTLVNPTDADVDAEIKHLLAALAD